MAAISADDIDRAIVTFCSEVDTKKTALGELRVERQLPWAFVQFPDSNDPRYVAPISGQGTIGLNAIGGQPYVFGVEYMRNAAFPHESTRGPVAQTGDDRLPGAYAVNFFGPV